METHKQYNATADILRIVAILAVIIIHTTTKTLQASTLSVQDIPFTIFLNQIFRLAVPLFFIISGFVLELNYHLHENYVTYLRKRLSRIFIPYVFWSTIYYFLVYTHHTHHFFSSLLTGDASYQLYFIPALFIFYLIFPVIHKYIKIIGNLWIITLLFIVQLLLLYTDYHVQELPFFDPLRIVLLNYFSFILGVFFARNHAILSQIIKKMKVYLFVGAIIFGNITFYEGINGYVTTHNYLMLYSQWRPSVLVYTLFLGGFLYWVFDMNITHVSLIKKIKKLSRLSFFVFFIHVIILEMLWNLFGSKIFQMKFVQHLWWDPSLFVAVALISFLVAYIAHKVPHLAKITG